MRFSASKTVFVLLAVTSCVAFVIGKLDEKNFMILASMAFGFYFSYKGSTPSPTDGSVPYAGK